VDATWGCRRRSFPSAVPGWAAGEAVAAVTAVSDSCTSLLSGYPTPWSLMCAVYLDRGSFLLEQMF